MSNVKNIKTVSKHKYYTGMVKSVIHQNCIKTQILHWYVKSVVHQNCIKTNACITLLRRNVN